MEAHGVLVAVDRLDLPGHREQARQLLVERAVVGGDDVRDELAERALIPAGALGERVLEGDLVEEVVGDEPALGADVGEAALAAAAVVDAVAHEDAARGGDAHREAGDGVLGGEALVDGGDRQRLALSHGVDDVAQHLEHLRGEHKVLAVRA